VNVIVHVDVDVDVDVNESSLPCRQIRPSMDLTRAPVNALPSFPGARPRHAAYSSVHEPNRECGLGNEFDSKSPTR
jgi:hypothetical protein